MGDCVCALVFEMAGSLPGSEEDRGSRFFREVTFQATWATVVLCVAMSLDVSLEYVLRTGERTGTAAKVSFSPLLASIMT